jgi:hypothetical protein
MNDAQVRVIHVKSIASTLLPNRLPIASTWIDFYSDSS